MSNVYRIYSYEHKRTYRGVISLNNEWDHSHEIEILTEKERTAFNHLRNGLCNLNLNILLRT